MNDTKRLRIAVVLALVGAALSVLLLMQHHGESAGVAAVHQICGDTTSGCDAVNQSRFSAPLGVPLAALGLAFYLSMAALAGLALAAGSEAQKAAARILVLGAGLALVIDVVLFGIQAVAIKAFCILCLATYACNAALTWLGWPHRGAPLAAAEGERRLVGRAALIGIVAALGVAVGAEGWLKARADRRAATILGAPGGSVVAGSPSELEQKVKALQETLDDPEKLRAYVTDRAVKQFDSAPVQMLDLSAPIKGPANAPIKVVEYADMLCPACRDVAGWFKDWVPAQQGRVAVYFKNYPLDQACNPGLSRTRHPGACQLALAGLCADQQGKFWEFHDKAFAEKAEKAEEADVKRFATAAGLDLGKLQACVAAPATRQRLDQQVAEAIKGGITGTPTLYINGRKVPDLGLFTHLIDEETKKMGPLAGFKPVAN
jgi:protein-disulfide isomerase/uncharacterized membrane protein